MGLILKKDSELGILGSFYHDCTPRFEVRIVELLDANLVELYRGEYVLAIMILTKKDIFGNWIEHHMCGDYHVVKTNPFIQMCHFPILDAFGYAKVFNMLDLRFGYHLLPLIEGDKVKETFWGMDLHGNNCLYQWFLPFGLINVLVNFQKIMD